MRKIILKMGTFAILAIIVLPAIRALAANEYTVLAPLPGTTLSDCPPGSTDCKTTLQKYLPGVFNLAIGLSAAFAVLMIVIGGFQYMSTDAIQGKSNGKQRIKNAIYGLVLVIGAWLILYTINPNLLELNLNIEKVATIAGPTGVTLGGELSAGTGSKREGYSLSQDQVNTNTAMVNDLEDNYNITVNNDGQPCTTGGTSGCTNLVGLPDAAYSGVKELEKDCGDCGIIITGGTEGGHASHGPNLPVLDLSTNNTDLNAFIKNPDNWTNSVQQTTLGDVYTVKLGDGRNATFLQESNPPHWHVVFGGI